MQMQRYAGRLRCILTRLILPLSLCLYCLPSLAKDFGIVVMDRETTTRQHVQNTNQIILKNRDNFEGEVEVDITVDPPVYGLDPYISGAKDNTFTPNNQVLDIDVMPRRAVTPGDYQVTVTVSGMKDGQRIERVATYTLHVAEPAEFGLSINPARLIIKQGASANTNVITTFKRNNDALVELQPAIHGAVSGISVELSGGGWQTNNVFDFPTWVVTRDPDPSGGNTETTQLTVKVAPETPPGEYIVSVRGTYNPRWVGEQLEDENRAVQGARLSITVVADPQYIHLQDPPNFDLFATEPVIVIPAGGENAYYGRETEVGVWGDRWNSYVKLAVKMREPSGGITVGLMSGPGGSSSQILRLPTNNRAYGRNLRIVVPGDTSPGTYMAVVTATSKAPDGTKLSKEVEIQIVVPPPRPTTGGDPGDPLSAISLPEGSVIDDGYPAEEADTSVDELVATACELLSVPADTIACSVHTFKKPETGSAKPAADVSLGETTALPQEAGGGFDTEVFVRNPDDNNLRKGCGDLNADTLISLTGFDWGPSEINAMPGAGGQQVVTVACNAAAQSGKGKKAIIRKHRDQLNVDLSTRKKADYKRKEDRNHVQMDDSNKHLIVRNTVNDAMANSSAQASCSPPKPNKSRRSKQVDVELDKVPDNAKKFAAGATAAINSETKPLEKLDGALAAVDSSNKLLKNLGTESKDLNRANAAAKFGRNLADLSVKSASGETVTTSDLKSVTDTVADLTGNKHVKTVAENFDVLLTLESLKLKIENGQKVETKDIKELVEKIDTVRGDRFSALGEVLGGIKKNADRITKAEDMIKQMEKVSNFLDKAAEGQNDSVKAFEAFSEYLDMLGTVAEKVPGMGEFMAQYAKAVKNMEGDVKTIAEAVRKRNEAIAGFNTAIEGYDYDKLMLDADQFEEDFDEGGGGSRISADQINVNDAVAGELERAEDAQKFWRAKQKCIIKQSARMKALKKSSDSLREDYSKLPNQAKLDKRARELRNYSNYRQAFGSDTDQLILKQAQRMGFDSVQAAKDVITREQNTPRGALDWADAAEKSARKREFIKKRMREISKQWHEAKRKRDDCIDKLKSAELAYWQALRDYVKKYSWFSVYLMDDSVKWKRGAHTKAQKEALALLDARIAAAGFQVTNGTVEIIVVNNCEEDSTLISAGN